MVLSVCCILLLVIVLGFSINLIEGIIKKDKSKISFKESMDLTELPIITFYNGDSKLNFLLDTGSNISYINSSIVESVQHEKTDKKIDTIGFGGSSLGNSICTMTVFYKKQKFIEEFVIVDLEVAFNTIKQESGVAIHGILGSKFFEKYKYVLDFSNLVAYTK